MKYLPILVLFTSCSFFAANPLIIPEIEHVGEELVEDVVQYEQKSPLTPAQVISNPLGATGPSSPVEAKNAP